MAARLLLPRRSLAALAFGSVALAPVTAFAEAPEDHKRKPIYDDLDTPTTATNPSPAPSQAAPRLLPPVTSDQPEQERPHGPTPTDRLAVQIGNARLFLYKYVVGAEDKINETVDSAFHLEQSFTNTIASLGPPRESGERLMPGAIYVLVAAMAGSIVTRNRNILLRAAAPLALGIGAGWTVLPVTMRNVSDMTWRYEQKFPVIAQAHVQAIEGWKKGVSFARVHSQLGAHYVDEKVTDARETVEGWVKQGK